MSIMSVQYVDMGEYYLIYGMATTMVVMLLLWFFIKVNIQNNHLEGLNTNTINYEIDVENTTPEADQAIDNLLNGTNVINMFDADHMSTDALFGKDFQLSDANYTRLQSTNENDPIEIEERKLRNNLYGDSISSPQMTAKQTKDGILKKGLYGDVPVYLHDDKDQPYTNQWRKVAAGVYLPNSRTYWQSTNKPDEAAFW